MASWFDDEAQERERPLNIQEIGGVSAYVATLQMGQRCPFCNVPTRHILSIDFLANTVKCGVTPGKYAGRHDAWSVAKFLKRKPLTPAEWGEEGY